MINGNTYYYHFDGLGNVVALSNDSGQIIERYNYDVFGRPTIRDANNSVNSVSSVANRYMFTGREYDSETGNYYYRARYYKPTIGRFLSSDPLGMQPDGGKRNWFRPSKRYIDGINLHTYVKNNPIRWIDPFGLGGGGMAKCQEQCDADDEVKYVEPRLKACYTCCLGADGLDNCDAKKFGKACAEVAKKIKSD